MQVYAVFISPTGNTKKAVRAIASGLAEVVSGGDFYSIDITPRDLRRGVLEFGPGDIVILGTPVYAGRVPNKLLPYLTEAVYGDGALGIPVVTYGNRAFDDALKELACVMYNNGMDIIGARAVVGEHAFTSRLAPGRPNEEDLAELREYGKKIGQKLKKDSISYIDVATLPGRDEDAFEYYVPKKENGEPASFLKAMVKTDTEKCTGCAACREICPMGCLDNSLTEPEGICIKCHGCVHACPEGAKYFDNEDLRSHIRMLEKNF